MQNATVGVLGKRKKSCKRTGLEIWNEEINTAVQEKQRAYNDLLSNRNRENEEGYKERRKTDVNTASIWRNLVNILI